MIRDFETSYNTESVEEKRAAALIELWALATQGATREETREVRERLTQLGGTDPASNQLAIEELVARSRDTEAAQ